MKNGNRPVLVRPGGKDSPVWAWEETPGSVCLRLPLPPSVNARLTPGYRWVSRYRYGVLERLRKPVLRHTERSTTYLEHTPLVRAALGKLGFRALDGYANFRFIFFLENLAYDTHNGFKLACDLLEMGGAVTDDKYILAQTARPIHAPSDPRLVVSFPREPDQNSP